MSLNTKTVQTIARLAKLDLQPTELNNYKDELSTIFNLFAKLESAPTQDVNEMTHPFDASLVLRADQVTEVDQREKYLALAPDSENGLYLVPKVID